MTETELREKVVSTAKAWYGLKESNGSFKVIIDEYNTIRPLPRGYKLTYKDPWCAGFVSAVAQKCGLTSIIFPECSCPRMIDLYKKAGRWMENDAYVPKIADIIFYDWDDDGKGDDTGEADHVGIVAEISGSTLRVIEGNISDAVGYRRVTVNARYIRGYGLPDYASKATGGTSAQKPAESVPSSGTSGGTVTVEPPKETQTAPSGDANSVKLDCTVQLPTLQFDDKGEYVKTMQLLLIGRHYTCGGAGADGDFGYATKTALLNWQRTHKLTADAICGQQTWASLLAGK